MKIKKKIISLVLAGMMLTSTIGAASAMDMSDVKKITGSDRYETAGKIMGNFLPLSQVPEVKGTVILVNADGNKLADGLSASGLAGVLKAPILLTHKDKLPAETDSRLESARVIYIIGSENSVSTNLERKLSNNGGFEVHRIGGNDRFETSCNVANEILKIKKEIGKVYITNGYRGEADAMSISSVAARDGEPIILTNGKTIDNASASILEKAKGKYAIGGVNNITVKLVDQIGATRISGNDRFETNAKIVKNFYSGNLDKFFLSDGYKLVDAMTGGPLAGICASPIVLVSKNSNKSVLKGAKELITLGGISDSVLKKCITAANAK